jgi:DNA repair exonuclease SbcCD nuclease subunit
MPAEIGFTAVHSSDLHLCGGVDPLDHSALEVVLNAAERLSAELVLLAGDVFDHNRAAVSAIDRAGDLLAAASMQIVILPGNHDCLVPDSVYRRGKLNGIRNVHVLGVSDHEYASLPDLDLEVWGRPHRDYSDMTPLAGERPRTTRWQILMAHGHWYQGKNDAHRSYLIRDEDLATCSADYIALGHWDRALQIGDGSVPAYYSGSPQLAKTVNAISFGPDGVLVRREPVVGA